MKSDPRLRPIKLSRLPCLLILGMMSCSEYDSATARAGLQGVEPVLTAAETAPADIPESERPLSAAEVERLRLESTRKLLEEHRASEEKARAEFDANAEEFRRTMAPRVRTGSSGGSTASNGRGLAQCDTALVAAKASERRFQALLAQGAVETGTREVTPGRKTKTRLNPVTGEWETLKEADLLGDVKGDELVSCDLARRRATKYPVAAQKCRSYEEQLREAQLAVRDAERCIRAARGR